MKSESVVFGVAGMCFGVIVGWVIGSQQAPSTPPPAPVAQSGSAAPAAESRAPVFDETKAQALRTVAERDPKAGAPRIQLANLYFDAERYQDAIKWYEEGLKLTPDDVNASTDLGVSYYYLNQADRAIEQFERSLKVDPKHVKTLLNLGIVRAFGKQDLDGAAKAWQSVMEIAPNSPEAQAAKRALDSLKSGHPPNGGPTG